MSSSAMLAFALVQAVAPELPVAREVLVVESTGRSGRTAVVSDSVLAALARGAWRRPSAGDEIQSATGEARAWREAQLDGEGALVGELGGGGWGFVSFEHAHDEVLLLDARGCSFVYAGGEPRAADMYALGNLRVPVAVHAGANEVLFRVARGRPQLAWSRPPAPVFVDERDRTLPDVLAGEHGPLAAGLVITNATASFARGCVCVASVENGTSTTTPLPDLAPFESRKCAVMLPRSNAASGSVAVQLAVRTSDGSQQHASSLTLDIRDRLATHRRTFVSELDGSVQYYSVVPCSKPDAESAPALILTLHGAGVEAAGQAACYAPRDWAHVVAPTNRRPFGFDWEDWGRLDALEVLRAAEGELRVDTKRRYLTGHSMGGHGTWNLGVHRSDLFAAIAPSAGWVDFWSYAASQPAEPADAIDAMLRRACNASRTLLLASNLAQRGVYVLHGDADDNVPVAQARRMREELAKFHPDFAYFEKAGAGHWWGNECVDWPPLMEFLRRHELAPPSLAAELSTVDPSLRDRDGWLVIEAQARSLELSHARAELDVATKQLSISTENVARLAIDAPEWPSDAESPAVTLDEQELGVAAAGAVTRFQRGADGRWSLSEPPASTSKRPGRAGPFKSAFARGFQLVYGTHGTAEENAWALAKARFDAETFRYRGNASPLLASDAQVLAMAASERDAHNFVLYGHREMNSAWRALVASDALDLRRGAVRIGERELAGDDLALAAVLPGRGAEQQIAVVAGTGLAGLRATNHLPYFVSGAGFPDWMVVRAAMLERGLDGIEGAGFFDDEWRVSADAADSAWRASDARR